MSEVVSRNKQGRGSVVQGQKKWIPEYDLLGSPGDSSLIKSLHKVQSFTDYMVLLFDPYNNLLVLLLFTDEKTNSELK